MKRILQLSSFLALLMLCFCAAAVYEAAAHDDDSVGKHHHLHHRHSGEFDSIPEKARARLNPLDGDPSALPAGKKLFGQHCAQCHGSKAEGSRKAPSLLIAEVQQATPGMLFWLLSNGIVRRGMPDWSRLPEPQRWQIITFLKSLKSGRSSATFDHQSHEVPARSSDATASQHE